jgi:hypothetical protein
VPVVKKFQFGVTLTTVGIPFTVPASNTAGVVIGTTTGATDLVGISIDKGTSRRLGSAQSTYSTTQGTGASSAERVVSLIVNPFAVWAFKMSGGSTSDTALASQTVTTASSGGTAITTAAEWSNPTYDEGVTWGYTGAERRPLPQGDLGIEHRRHRDDPLRLSHGRSATSSCGRRTGRCRPSRSS